MGIIFNGPLTLYASIGWIFARFLELYKEERVLGAATTAATCVQKGGRKCWIRATKSCETCSKSKNEE